MKDQIKKLVIAVMLFLISIIIGIFGFMYLEGFNGIEAFYMSVITISTVGFNEVHELSEHGRLFTAIYILINLGILGYVLSVVTSYIFEGGLKVILTTYMEERELKKLRNHVIVCGYGRNGSRASEELWASNRDFVIIEKNPDHRELLSRSKDFHIIIGDGTEDDSLKRAGIEKAKAIIITTPSDADNVFISLTARALNPTIQIISRASEIETEGKLYRAGADKVIMPDLMGGMLMAQLVTKPVVIEFLDLLTGVSKSTEGYHLEEVGYGDLRDEFKDHALKDLRVSSLSGCTVVGIKDDKKGLIPGPSSNTIVGPDDHLIILGSHKSLKAFMEHFTNLTYPIQRIN